MGKKVRIFYSWINKVGMGIECHIMDFIISAQNHIFPTNSYFHAKTHLLCIQNQLSYRGSRRYESIHSAPIHWRNGVPIGIADGINMGIRHYGARDKLFMIRTRWRQRHGEPIIKVLLG